MSREEDGDGAEAAPSIHEEQNRFQESQPDALECGYSDVRELQQIEKCLHQSLAAACLERASGEIFSRPASVASDVKKDMLEYLHQQSQGYQLGVGEWSYSSSRKPSETAEEMLESFVKSKRNLIRRMSSKIGIGSTSKIEDLVNELERGGVWNLGQRENLAKVLLMRLDVHKTSHCERKFTSADELSEHKSVCLFRPVFCENAGCGEVFSAVHCSSHDADCPFKVMACNQGCGEKVMRMEMEKHCTTVCAMKMVNCPFASVGCSHILPQGALDQHFSTMVTTHLLFVLQSQQRHDISLTTQAQRVSLLEKSVSLTERMEAADMSSLSLTVKEQEAKIKKLEEELKKLKKEVSKSGDVSTKLLQMEKNLKTAQKQ